MNGEIHHRYFNMALAFMKSHYGAYSDEEWDAHFEYSLIFRGVFPLTDSVRF
jgi:hypothetical protein